MNGQPRETDNIGYTRRRQRNHKHSTICVGHHYTQSNTNNVNKTLLWGYEIGKYFSIVGLNKIFCSNLCACVCKTINHSTFSMESGSDSDKNLLL